MRRSVSSRRLLQIPLAEERAGRLMRRPAPLMSFTCAILGDALGVPIGRSSPPLASAEAISDSLGRQASGLNLLLGRRNLETWTPCRIFQRATAVCRGARQS